MGMRLQFSCQGCEYRTVSALPKKKDRGYFNEMKPMICVDCKEVVQVLTGKAKEMGADIIETISPECPKCKGTKLSDWQGECPCCKTKMKEEGKPILWD